MSDKISAKLISLIACIDRNLGIGLNNALIYAIPGDLARFKRLTLGNTVIMGANTFRSIGHALPNRQNIVLTSSSIEVDGVVTSQSIEESLRLATSDRIFVIGGSTVFDEFLETADRLLLTVVNSQSEADTFFPDFSQKFALAARTAPHTFGGLTYSYNEYRRRSLSVKLASSMQIPSL